MRHNMFVPQGGTHESKHRAFVGSGYFVEMDGLDCPNDWVFDFSLGDH